MQLAMIVRCGIFASTFAVLMGSVAVEAACSARPFDVSDCEASKCSAADCAKTCNSLGCGGFCSGEGCANGCTGETCGAECTGKDCATNCIGNSCGRKCTGENCATGCEGFMCGMFCSGEDCATGCTGPVCGTYCSVENCATGCKGLRCGSVCTGDGCATNCIGDECADGCQGVNCGARCKGARCATQCGSQDEDEGKPYGYDDEKNPRYNDDWEPKQPGFDKQTGLVGPIGPLRAYAYDDDRVFHPDFPESVDCGMECEGTDCAKSCTGAGCGASCTGLNCAANCQGAGCGKNCLGDGCGIRNETLRLTSYEAPGRKDFNLQCEQYVLDWHCQYNNTAFPNCQWHGDKSRCCDGSVCPAPTPAPTPTTSTYITFNACCRATRLNSNSQEKPNLVPVLSKSDMETDCVQACEQDPRCIAYEAMSKKKDGKWINKCEHYMNNTFLSIDKVSRASKSCRKNTVCGSEAFAALVPPPSTSSPTPAPTPTPKQCSPAEEIGMIYKPMDSNPAFCNCDRCGKGKKKCRTVEKSADACFQRCAATNGCVRINFWAKDGGCHLVEAGATGTPNKKVTATSFQADC